MKDDAERARIVAGLRQAAKASSSSLRMIAEAKSLRQGDCNPPRADLYSWPMPEQTLEWRAADEIERLAAMLDVAPIPGEE